MQVSPKQLLLKSTLIICLLFTVRAEAQNYHLVNEARDLVYARLTTTGQDSIYYFIQIDSFTVDGTDSLFYFNQQIRNTPDPDCEFVYDDTVLLGNRVLVTSDTDGTYIFFNNQNDSIFIKSNIKNGDSWKMYKWPDGSYVKATVINHLYGGVVDGIFDSLYRVKLNVFTLGGTMLTGVFPNDTKIDISENYGLVETFNLNIFPLPGDSIGRVMRGITNPDTGTVDVNAFHAFDFKTGYEYHYREELAPDLFYGVDKRISGFKYFVLAKTLSEESATYTFERIQFDTLYGTDGPILHVIWDTIDITYNYADYAVLDTPELKIFENENFGYSDWVKNDTLYAGIAHKYIYDWFQFDETTSCLSNPESIFLPERLYGENLGVIHQLDSINELEYYKLDLTYFKVGLNEWGTPFDFSILDDAVANLNQNNTFNIYPNPSHNFVTIPESLINAATFNYGIYNINGMQMKSGKNQKTISISDLPNGTYFIQIEMQSGIWHASFVKQN